MPEQELQTINVDLPIFDISDPAAIARGWNEEWLNDVISGFDAFSNEEGTRITPALAFAKEPPTKLGHNDTQPLAEAEKREDGQPALGWVTKLWNSGPVLWATLSEVPAKLGQLINAGRWKRVSAEFYCDVEWAENQFARILRAVSLLGKDPPAIKSLADVVALHGEEEEGLPWLVEAYSANLLVDFEEADKAEPLQVVDAYAVWSPAFINNLPDSSFAYIELGGEMDDEGKTSPRSLRHLPFKDADGNVDLPHLRNALSQLPQTDFSEEVKEEAQAELEKHSHLLEEHTENKEEEADTMPKEVTEEKVETVELAKEDTRQEFIPGMDTTIPVDREKYDELVVLAASAADSQKFAEETKAQLAELRGQVEKMSEEAKAAEQLRAQVEAEKDRIKLERIDLYLEQWQGSGKVDGKGRPVLAEILTRADHEKVEAFGEENEEVSLFDLIVKYHENMSDNTAVDLEEHAETAEDEQPKDGNPDEKQTDEFVEVEVREGTMQRVDRLALSRAVDKYREEHPDVSVIEAMKRITSGKV